VPSVSGGLRASCCGECHTVQVWTGTSTEAYICRWILLTVGLNLPFWDTFFHISFRHHSLFQLTNACKSCLIGSLDKRIIAKKTSRPTWLCSLVLPNHLMRRCPYSSPFRIRFMNYRNFNTFLQNILTMYAILEKKLLFNLNTVLVVLAIYMENAHHRNFT